MTDARTASTVPRRQLGRHLRAERNRAGLTIAAVAQTLGWSDQKIWRLETGQTSANPFDIEGVCRLYGASATVTDALVGLARATKDRGWWCAEGQVVPKEFNMYVGLEEAASEMGAYQTLLVPGLLQTSDYTRAVMTTGHPEADDAEIERRVTRRLARQAILTRPVDPPRFTVVLGEAVLRQRVGAAGVMAFQLRRLLESTELPNVNVRVIPFTARLHLGVLTGPFQLLRFPDTDSSVVDREPPVVHIEHYAGELYLDSSDQVQRYDEVFRDLMDVADPNSRDLIAARMKEWTA